MAGIDFKPRAKTLARELASMLDLGARSSVGVYPQQADLGAAFQMIYSTKAVLRACGGPAVSTAELSTGQPFPTEPFLRSAHERHSGGTNGASYLDSARHPPAVSGLAPRGWRT